MTDIEVRRQAARRAFWSEAPLVTAFRDAHGDIAFSLKQLIEFAVTMPAPQFNACRFDAGAQQ